MFSLSCMIGRKEEKNAMLDLKVSINAMSLNMYEYLGLNDCRNTHIAIQRADKSCISPLSVVEDVLVKVKDLIFPCDFHIMDIWRSIFRTLMHLYY